MNKFKIDKTQTLASEIQRMAKHFNLAPAVVDAIVDLSKHSYCCGSDAAVKAFRLKEIKLKK